MRKRSLFLSVPLSLLLILSPTQALGKTVKDSPPKAMNIKEEKKALTKIGSKNGSIPVKAGKALTLKFDDGSKIVYTTGVTATPKERLPKTSTSKNQATKSGITRMSTSYKTYNVKKVYFYGHSVITTRLYTDVKHSGRCTYIRSNTKSFKGTWARNEWQKTRTIDGTGCTNDYATSELRGEFTTYTPNNYNVYNRTYTYRMDIDPAGGGPYLRIID